MADNPYAPPQQPIETPQQLRGRTRSLETNFIGIAVVATAWFVFLRNTHDGPFAGMLVLAASCGALLDGVIGQHPRYTQVATVYVPILLANVFSVFVSWRSLRDAEWILVLVAVVAIGFQAMIPVLMMLFISNVAFRLLRLR